MDVREKLVELLTNSQQLDVLDWATGWEEAANYLIAHGVTVQEWISVDDRIPDDNDRVIALIAAFCLFSCAVLAFCACVCKITAPKLKAQEGALKCETEAQ